jgi:superfamily II DNA or RNA helicase
MEALPFVIDNQLATMRDALNRLLAQYAGGSLDVATAYFNVGGWHLLAGGLRGLGTFRLLLGDEPEVGADLGLREVGARPIKGLIRELSEESFNESSMRQVEELIAFLRQERVQVRLYTGAFLHAKSYQFYADSGFTRIAPQAAIVGSSNFTRAGLLTNKELNFMHRADFAAEEVSLERVRGIMEEDEREQLAEVGEAQRRLAAGVPGLLALDELTWWFRQQWHEARDFKNELIELLDASKFGRKAYTPYQIYMKAIFEYFRDDLEAEEFDGATRSAVELSEFQEDAVKKARKILARYDGVMIADSVGLGKTWIGKKLLEDYAYHRRYRAVVICPAALQKMWRDELAGASIAATLVTQEALGREEFDVSAVGDADVVLIDESHNFRNHGTQRYENLERVLAANQRRGALSGARKKLILLTATPINNSIFDLYNQINLFTGGDRAYFAAAGIGDLQRYFIAANRLAREQESGMALFNLLEEVVIRRTRPFIKKAYPNATIKGQPIHWPERRLRTIHYNLEATYSGIYSDIVACIEGLRLAPYHLEVYKKQGIERDQFEEGREEALIGIFKSRFLKRLESSIAAFRISVSNLLAVLNSDSASIPQAGSAAAIQQLLTLPDDEDDATASGHTPPAHGHTPPALSNIPGVSIPLAGNGVKGLPALDPAQYDIARLHKDMQHDADALNKIAAVVVSITSDRDAKLRRLFELLTGELKGRKTLIFTYYRDTLQYLYANLQILLDGSGLRLACMDSSTDVRERAKIVARFAPRANNRPDIAGSPHEINILISTDVLSEGQNLQDCGVLINYDLPWNPTRMIQRAGRIDRIGASFDTLEIINMFPDAGLEKLLGLVESLSQKIAAIDRSGLLDASVLGEAVHPQNFNTLRRIEEQDNRVIEEQEQFAELASNEFLLQNLKGLLDSNMRQMLEDLPDGIHSGLLRRGARGIFFYFTTRESRRYSKQERKRQHYWRYIDLSEDSHGQIEDNRYLIINQIQCLPDTPRVVPASDEVNIFELQEKVIASILQASVQQAALAQLPQKLDPIQQTIATVLRGYLNHPAISRKEIVAALQKVNVPQPRVYIKTLRKAYETYRANGQIDELVSAVQGIGGPVAAMNQHGEKEQQPLLKREDLKLVCFEYVWQ